MSNGEKAAGPIPAAFLPPPKRQRKHFSDVPLLEAPDDDGCQWRRLQLSAQAWPDGLPEQRRRWAEAVSYLLVGLPGRSRPLEWGQPGKRKGAR